ncbi:hypothetical protein LTR84_002627 [Exophiala bonariae]|uniref:Uncharacterized protein n=1 Tax=Exophiala bonariae TaxID=1690606 RepID=A0AAV9NDP6_9EURO|nr:hypothetical protein LTR84_002627 [Exophiala bonariae]
MSLLSASSASLRPDVKSKHAPNNHHHSHFKAPKLPGRPKAITTGMSLLRNVKAFLTPSGSQAHLSGGGLDGAFTKAKTETDLFPATDPAVDGEECLRDCDGCTVHYPAKFKIDEDDTLYGHVKGWETHLIVGTGKTDWVRDVTDEKASVMQAVGRVGVDRKNGKIMLSASNMPNCAEGYDGGRRAEGEEEGSDCLLLPAWTLIEDVKPSQVDVLMKEVVEKSVTNSSPLGGRKALPLGNGESNGHAAVEDDAVAEPDLTGLRIGGANEPSTPSEGTQTPQDLSRPHEQQEESTTLAPSSISSITFKTRPIPHSYLILMCSHKTRDARCGQSAPLLRKEFERILRPMGLYRDLHDDRPGGVGLYFINHVGGHKYSANVMIYRRESRARNHLDASNGISNGALNGQPAITQNQTANPVAEDSTRDGEAVQLIWLARVRPEDCENIIRYTILQGKLVKPQRQLRGGFDRERGLLSW